MTKFCKAWRGFAPSPSTTILCPAAATSHKTHRDVGAPEEHQAHFRRHREEAHLTPRTPSCYSYMHKFSCCTSLEHWRGEFEGPGPEKGNVGLYPHAGSHRPTEAVAIYTDIGSALECNKSLHVYPSVRKGCRSYFLCLFNPQLQNCCGNHPAVATACQLWKTNPNPGTKGKTTMEHE